MRGPKLTVKQLIAELQTYDEDAIVCRGDSENILFPIEGCHLPEDIEVSSLTEHNVDPEMAVIIE